MSERLYLKLPIRPDEGFPQAFQIAFLGTTYEFQFYVNVLETDAAVSDDDRIFDLPERGAYLVMRIARIAAGTRTTLFHRKLVPNHPYEAGELALVFRRMRVARRNINGFGSFGSDVIGGVAQR
jgi:hypothetical protein